MPIQEESAVSSNYTRIPGSSLMFGVTIFISAFLLFQVQVSLTLVRWNVIGLDHLFTFFSIPPFWRLFLCAQDFDLVEFRSANEGPFRLPCRGCGVGPFPLVYLGFAILARRRLEADSGISTGGRYLKAAGLGDRCTVSTAFQHWTPPSKMVL